MRGNFNRLLTSLKPKRKEERSHIMPQIAKNKKVDSNAELEKPSVDFDTLSYPEESINAYDTGDESAWKSDFSTDASDYDSLDSELTLN